MVATSSSEVLPGVVPGLAIPEPRRLLRRRRGVAVRPPTLGTSRHIFAFEGVTGAVAAALLLGDPRRAFVEIADGRLLARFGPWSVGTTVDNVVDVSITGPYRAFKVVGPPRVSLADRGLTFATNARRGVCIRFDSPVRGLEPFGRILHPSLTVTVADCDALAADLSAARSRSGDV